MRCVDQRPKIRDSSQEPLLSRARGSACCSCGWLLCPNQHSSDTSGYRNKTKALHPLKHLCKAAACCRIETGTVPSPWAGSTLSSEGSTCSFWTTVFLGLKEEHPRCSLWEQQGCILGLILLADKLKSLRSGWVCFTLRATANCI